MYLGHYFWELFFIPVKWFPRDSEWPLVIPFGHCQLVTASYEDKLDIVQYIISLSSVDGQP